MKKITQKTMISLFGFKSRNTLNEWNKSNDRKVLDLINMYFDENDIIEFLNKGKISEFDDYIKRKNYSNLQKNNQDKIIEMFLGTYHELKVKGEEIKLKSLIENFNIMQILETKFRDMYAEQNFFQYILTGYSNKISNILLLAKILKDSNLETTLETAKKDLLYLLNKYELKLIEDRVTHLLTNNKKDILKGWINEQLDDLSCYIILTNIPKVMEILTSNINHLNKKILENISKEVKGE